MANQRDSSDKNKEELDFERELKRLKFSAKYGVHFEEEKACEPPLDESEEDFLDRMKEFEEAMRNPQTTEIRALLGFPKFPKVEDLADDELEAAIDLVTTALANRNIALDVCHPTPAREIYRFLTEELLYEDAGMAGAGGMTMHFIYEEFYPNHEEEIKSDVSDILNFICRGHNASLPWRIATEVSLDGKLIPKEEFEMLLDDHRDIFEGMTFIGVDSLDIKIEDSNAKAKASFRYYLDQSSGSQGEYSTTAEFEFKLDNGTFDLTRLIIEKFGIR
jgi:hypothetical protein